MVKVTLRFGHPNEESFLQSHIWEQLSKLILHKACISFCVEEE